MVYVPIVCSVARSSEKALEKVSYLHRMRVIDKPCFSKKTMSSAQKHKEAMLSSRDKNKETRISVLFQRTFLEGDL